MSGTAISHAGTDVEVFLVRVDTKPERFEVWIGDLAGTDAIVWTTNRGTSYTPSPVLHEGKLYYVRGGSNRSELAPLSAERFLMLGVPVKVELTFRPAGPGAPARLEFVSEGSPPLILEAVEPFAPTPEQLAEYAGDYYSEELDVTHRLRARDGRLYISVGNDPAEMPAAPLVRDEFGVQGVVVRFRRDAQGRVGGLTLDAGRVRGVAFVRK